jgi:hypothetical protein
MLPIEDTILELCAARGPEKSICPSEAARALSPEGQTWSKLMPAVRASAVSLARAGRIVILRKGQPADPGSFKGVYRLRIADDAAALMEATPEEP